MANEKRSSFTGKLGFVMAAAGSAVGLGNIWRFPYLAAKYGGGIFLLVYLILAVTFGFALMTAEIAIGRKTGLSAIGAFRKLDKRYTFVGYLAAIVPMIILPYYSVIGGWVTKYLYTFLTGGMMQAANPGNSGIIFDGWFSIQTTEAVSGFFTQFIGGSAESVGWFFLFIAATALIVMCGVDKGVEKVSKVMMPILIVLSVFIAIYSLCMPGAMGGFLYYITPNFADFSVTTVLAAMGQLFYSMSLAMGIMITYGSYMKKDVSIESSVSQIEFFDTGIAFIAGLMIVPAVFAFSNGNLAAMNKGAGLMFITLPQVFQTMPFGDIIGAAFFLMVLFAALTSSISLMETVVSIVCDKMKLKRIPACLVVFGVSLLLGIPSALGSNLWSSVKIIGMEFLDFFDFISNSVLMPIVALLTCIFIGYVLKPKTVIEEVESCGKFKRKKLFSVMIKYIAPIFIVLILAFSVLEALKILKI